MKINGPATLIYYISLYLGFRDDVAPAKPFARTIFCVLCLELIFGFLFHSILQCEIFIRLIHHTNHN